MLSPVFRRMRGFARGVMLGGIFVILSGEILPDVAEGNPLGQHSGSLGNAVDPGPDCHEGERRRPVSAFRPIHPVPAYDNDYGFTLFGDRAAAGTLSSLSPWGKGNHGQRERQHEGQPPHGH